MAKVGVDACFLIGLYDLRDQHHQAAVEHFNRIFGTRSPRNVLVAPWPVLYECLGTRQARDTIKREQLRRHWDYLNRNGRLRLLDDAPFRELALQSHLKNGQRPFSLADRVIRAMIADASRPFDYFVTFNGSDFRDACLNARVRLICENKSDDY